MASIKKKRKLKNGFLDGGCLKNKKKHIKGVLFYTPSDRQENKNGKV